MTSPTKQKACVKVDHVTYLLPMEKAMKLIDIIRHAVRCDEELDSSSYERFYTVRSSAPDVELKLVQDKQIRLPEGTRPSRRRALTNNPSPILELTHEREDL